MKRRGLFVAALAALPFLLGYQCEMQPSADPGTTLGLELVQAIPQTSGYVLHLALWVDTDQTIQALDVSLDWQGDEVGVRPLMDPAFDDDGQVLGGPLPLLVETPPYRYADVRHGDTALSGTIPIGSVWVRALEGGDSQVTVTVTLARPDGSLVEAGAATLSFSESQLP